MEVAGFEVGNRWCIHPMEGWDANRDGSPSEHTLRRWRNFGLSGAKLIWGGEAAAVRPDGRANPNQTLATESNRARPGRAARELQRGPSRARSARSTACSSGLQLTHSGPVLQAGRSSRSAPRIAYHHPLLDAKFKIDPNDQRGRVDRRRARRAHRRLRRGGPPGAAKSAFSSST